MKTNKDIPSNGCMKCNCDSVTPKAEHTPTPKESRYDYALPLRYDESYGAIRDDNNDTFYGTARNWKKIVRAVNAHDDLLLTLEEVKAYLIKTGAKEARSYVEQIADVIAKAEGK